MAPTASATTRSPTYLLWLPLTLLCLVQFAITADNAILINSTAALLHSFHTTVAQVQVANAMFPLCASTLMVIGGFIGLMIGWKRILQIGLVILTAGELVAIFSANMHVFTFGARALTGIGASLATPGMLGLIPGLYHNRRRAIAFSAIAAANGLAAAIGPIVGGAIIVSVGWRPAFLGLAILFALILCASVVIRSIPRPARLPRLDVVGGLLLIMGMASAFIGLLTVNSWGLIYAYAAPFTFFGLSPSLFLIIVGVFIFCIFIRWQKFRKRVDEKTLLPLIFMNNRQVRAGLYLTSLVFIVMGSISFLMITYLQVVVDLDALRTGFALSAYALSLALFAILTPIYLKKLSPKVICNVGILILVLSCFMLFTELQTAATSHAILIGLSLAGIGCGLVVSQSSIVVTHATSQHDAEQSGGIQGAMRNLGMAIGVAISGVILIAALTTTLKANAAALPQLSVQAKNHIELLKNVPFLSNQQVETLLKKKGAPPGAAQALLKANQDARLSAARMVLLSMAVLFFLFLWPTRYLPNYSLMLDVKRRTRFDKLIKNHGNTMTIDTIPVITIDGPSGTGKGTVTHMLAHSLSWHMLDSGAIYRLLAYIAKRDGVDPDNVPVLTQLAEQMNAHFRAKEPGISEIWLDGAEVSSLIRTETIGNLASQVGKHAAVRDALVACQRAYRQAPGLVTDGRDMGTVIFPDAALKLFLTAEPEERARRRLKQLQRQGIDAILDEILTEQHARDVRDRARVVAPLKPADDAVIIDTTLLNSQEVFVAVRGIVHERLGV